MAYWFTVYGRQEVPDLSAEWLRRGITDGDPEAPAGADYLTLAELSEVDTAQVEPALQHLTVRQGRNGMSVHYSPDPRARPVELHVWSTPERITEEVDEALEGRRPPDVLHERLRETRAVFGIELGFSQLGAMGEVIAVEIVRYLAQKADGVVVDDDQQWFEVVGGGFHSHAAEE